MDTSNQPPNMDEEEEDDYLSAAFLIPSTTPNSESSIQRTARLKREAAERGRILPKRQREAIAKANTQRALDTAMDVNTSKGAKMLMKMGYVPGKALQDGGIVEPLKVNLPGGKKEERMGLGSAGKRKLEESELDDELEEVSKKVKVDGNVVAPKVDLEDFRLRQGRQQEERRLEGSWWGAMKTLEVFETSAEPKKGELKDVAVLIRPFVRVQEAKEKGLKPDDVDEEEDPEVEAYQALAPAKRFEKVVSALREGYWYCFWCKEKYDDEAMEGCPGEGEDVHG